MADLGARETPPDEPQSKAQVMADINEEARGKPTRPGWIAILGIIAFLVAFFVYIIYAT